MIYKEYLPLKEAAATNRYFHDQLSYRLFSELIDYKNEFPPVSVCGLCPPPQVIPFAGTILGGLLPGEMVLIQGSVPSGADR